MIACLQVLFTLFPFAATVLLELHLAVKSASTTVFIFAIMYLLWSNQFLGCKVAAAISFEINIFC